MIIKRLFLAAALIALPSLMTACAEVPKSPEARAEALAVNDPLEPVNRVVFDVNDFMDRLLIKPITELYRFAIPDYVRERVANVLSNMNEPVIFVNNVLQGEISKAGTTAERFAVNTTLGIGGIFEVADDWNIRKQKGDFGQTLSSWGVGSGPYLVLPLFGPSNIRDAIGMGADTFMSPWQYVVADYADSNSRDAFNYSRVAADGLTRREQSLDEYEALRAGSLDFYAEMRSVYRQYRDKQLGIQNEDAARMFDDLD